MSEIQIEINNKKTKKVKKEKPKGNLACILTLIFEILITVGLFTLAMAPFLHGLFAFTFAAFFILFTIFITLVSAGLVWTSEGFRVFESDTWNFIGKLFEGPEVLVQSIQPHIVLISIVLLVAAASGFVVNLIFFIKHKKNKVKFILSCVFLLLAIINMILAITIYLNWK